MALFKSGDIIEHYQYPVTLIVCGYDEENYVVRTDNGSYEKRSIKDIDAYYSLKKETPEIGQVFYLQVGYDTLEYEVISVTKFKGEYFITYVLLNGYNQKVYADNLESFMKEFTPKNS